jgi:hypothetical protein
MATQYRSRPEFGCSPRSGGFKHPVALLTVGTSVSLRMAALLREGVAHHCCSTRRVRHADEYATSPEGTSWVGRLRSSKSPTQRLYQSPPR